MKALMIAFSMYSKIPMPRFLWEEEDRKRAMCYFPLVGAVIGLLFFFCFDLLAAGNTGVILRSAVLTTIPLLVTGGIHMDGFLDTCDARASYGSREKKLEILKDSRTGAFAVMKGILYLLLYFAACTELTGRSAAITGMGFVLSRAFSGFSASVFPKARTNGMLADFMKDSSKTAVAAAMAFYGTAAAGFMIWFGKVSGAAAVLAAVIAFLYYRHMAFKEFGGVTGDLAGYFLQLCELFILLASVIL